MSSLESRYEHKAKQAALTEEAMELLTDELQEALDGLKSREERNLHREEEMEDQRKRVSDPQDFYHPAHFSVSIRIH